MDKLFILLGGAVLGVVIGYSIQWKRKKSSGRGEHYLLVSIHQNIHTLMAKSQERFDKLMGRLDTVTTDIATDYKTLLDKISELGSDVISEESFAKHEANIAKLETLGSSVDNPVPAEPPAEPPV